MPVRLRHWLRPLVVGPMVVVLAGAGWLGVRSTRSTSTSATVTERTVEVASGTMRQTASASGTLEPADTEDLSFSVSGQGLTAGGPIDTC